MQLLLHLLGWNQYYLTVGLVAPISPFSHRFMNLSLHQGKYKFWLPFYG